MQTCLKNSLHAYQICFKIVDEFVRTTIVHEQQRFPRTKITQSEHLSGGTEGGFNSSYVVDHRFSDAQRSQHVQNQDVVETSFGWREIIIMKSKPFQNEYHCICS